MAFFDNIFASSGTARNGPQPPAPAPAAPAPAPAAPAPAPATAPTIFSQLDEMKSMWQTPVNDKGEPIQAPANPLSQPLFQNDPAKITEAAKRLDFTAGIDPAVATKALGGDVASLMELINSSTQNAFVAAAQYSTGIANQGLLANNQNLLAAIPGQIKQAQLKETASENPVLNHPSVAPIITDLKRLALQRDPSLTAAEVAAQVDTYFKTIVGAYQESTPEAKQRQSAVAASETDWLKWGGNA